MTAASAYLNGKWLDEVAQLTVGVDDVGFLMGATVSERLRTYRHQIFRQQDHLNRLRRSLDIIGLDADSIIGEIGSVLPESVQRATASLAADDDVGIVVFVTPGRQDARSIDMASCTRCVYATPLRFGAWANKYRRGQDVVISNMRQVPNDCWPSELKCRSRMHYYLADHRALLANPNARAVMLDENGHIAEASSANVLIVEGGAIHSPTDRYILPGVSAAYLKELAERMGVAWQSGDITPTQFAQADEVLLTSTSPGVLPVCRCDGAKVGCGKPGIMFERIIEAWSQHVGVDIRQQAIRYASRC